MDELKGREAEQEPGQADAPGMAPEEAARLRRRSFIRRSAEVATMSLFGLGGVDGVIQRVLGRVAEQTQMHGLADAIANRLAGSGVMTPRAHAAPSTADCPSGYGGVNPLDQCQPGPVACEPAPFGCVPPVACEPEPFACVPPHACPEPYGCPEPFGACPPGFLHNCPEGYVPAFTCHATTPFPFTGCLWPDFKCEWGEQFHCVPGPTSFDCDKVGQPPGHVGFSCPPWVDGTGWFDCYPPALGGDFDCSYPDTYDCGGTADHYLCAGVAVFFETCGPGGPPDWRCQNTPDWFHGVCGAAVKDCPPPPEGFACQKPAKFACGEHVGHAGRFVCNNFDCTPGVGMQYDFDCENRAFKCGAPAGGQTFECDARHVFCCRNYGTQADSGFSCGNEEGDVFNCKAGGNRCNVGVTGLYSDAGRYPDQIPGDFYCYGEELDVESFRCAGQFTCSDMADDFICWDEGVARSFTCTGGFSACSPSGSDGVFKCDNVNNDFYCDPGFVCPGGKFTTW